MKEVRFFYVPNADTSMELPSEEATHALRVLRMKVGDEMMLMDGKGTFYHAEMTLASSNHCMYSIKEILPQERQWTGNVHLAIAPTKMMDRIEWMIEKSVEIGVDEISFLDCQFSERRTLKLPRAEKIAIAATKQSRKAWMTTIHEMIPFNDFISMPRHCRKYIAHCYDEVPRSYLFDELNKPSDTPDVLVLVGPEGDFSIDEVRRAMANGYQSVHLGKSRLRTETAGLSAVMMMQLAQS
jgi:16S rRNA (uracil1498-N3)-methyltransferase